MRVGVYVDGYNLYYGMRGLCGRGTLQAGRMVNEKTPADERPGWYVHTIPHGHAV